MLQLYVRLIGARIRAQMQYKVSFWLELIGFALTTGLEFAVVAILFSRFPSVAGWSVFEVGLLYGMTSMALGMAEMVGRGFDAPFEAMMQAGTFDKVLTRPLGTFFQVISSEFQLRRLGRVIQGGVVFSYGLFHLSIDWTPAKLILLPLTMLSGFTIYLALMVISATICFWTIKTPEVVNIFTFGGDFMMSYPLSIYNRFIRTVFIYVVPLAFINYPTALTLLERTDPHGLPSAIAWASPLAAALFFAVALRFWRIGLTKYTSTGS
jgi:ABC-2 type transport system permease protein